MVEPGLEGLNERIQVRSWRVFAKGRRLGRLEGGQHVLGEFVELVERHGGEGVEGDGFLGESLLDGADLVEDVAQAGLLALKTAGEFAADGRASGVGAGELFC